MVSMRFIGIILTTSVLYTTHMVASSETSGTPDAQLARVMTMVRGINEGAIRENILSRALFKSDDQHLDIEKIDLQAWIATLDRSIVDRTPSSVQLAADILNLWTRNLRRASAQIIAKAIAVQGPIKKITPDLIAVYTHRPWANPLGKSINTQDLDKLSQAILTGQQQLSLHEFISKDIDAHRNPLAKLQRWLYIYYMLSPFPMTYRRTAEQERVLMSSSLYTHLCVMQETLDAADAWDNPQAPDAQQKATNHFVNMCVMAGYDQEYPTPDVASVKKFIHVDRALAALPQTFSALRQWIVAEKPILARLSITTTIPYVVSYVAPTWLQLTPELHNLQALSLNYCTAGAIQFLLTPPHPFASTLRWLSLDGCHLQEIPRSITTFTQLTHLFLANNNIRSIPPEMAQLTHLILLDVQHNPLQALPPWLASINKEEQLFIYQ